MLAYFDFYLIVSVFMAFIVGFIWCMQTKSPDFSGLFVIEKFKNWQLVT